jgi:flagellar hook-associated protein 3
MSLLPLNLARVSNLMRTDMVSQQVTRTQAQLLQVQDQLSTGKRIGRPSDDPADAAVAMQLQKTLEQRQAFSDNIDAARSQLSEVDSTLGDLTDLLQQAQQIASANAGSDVTPDARIGAAALVQSLYTQAIAVGNKSFNGTYLFGGDKATAPPFETAQGGVKFVGSSTSLANQVDENSSFSFMVDGAAVFGAMSTRVQGTADLTPSVTATTRIGDLHGATGDGIRATSIVLGNGTVTKSIDLSKADTVGDVVTAINAAAVGNITAAIGANGNVVLSTTGADDISVREATGGTTASDLGLLTPTGAGAGVAVTGANLKPTINELTPLTALKNGAGIDLTSGLTITNGTNVVTVNFSSPPLRVGATMGDLLNAINGSGADVQAEINDVGTGINILNPNQGARMTIAENGGTTAADLGVRTFTTATSLSELNDGIGIHTVAGNDLQVTRSDGTSFAVDLDGAVTVQDVLDKINDADTVNGTLPAKVVASLATTGNGIILTDTAGGGASPMISALNFSEAMKDLGLDQAATANVISGRDVNMVAAQGIFANLAALRDALTASDQKGITKAGEAISTDQDRVVLMRGETGAKVKELESRKDRLDDQNLATKSLLSEVQDTDFTATIAKFQSLQTSLQAAMQAGSKTMNLSLMDFLG